MKYSLIGAIALGAATIALPTHAGAAQEGGTVCGRVNAPSSYILSLELSPQHGNIVVAHSANGEVSTRVNVDGTFCFRDLAAELYTVTAFPQAFPGYSKSVTPVAGKTVTIQLDPPNG